MSHLRKLTGPSLLCQEKTQSLVIFLHGWGSNGNDLIQIATHWQNIFPNTSFYAPNGPEECDIDPTGKQWFSLNNMSSIDMISGTEKAAKDIVNYIDKLANHYSLNYEKIILVGFSQGAMLSLHLGILKPFAGILAYSGALISNPQNKLEHNLNVFLIHGALDDRVSPDNLHLASDKLQKIGANVKTHISPDTGHSIDAIGLQLGADFIKVRLQININNNK